VSELIITNWKAPVERLRQKINDAVVRWLPKLKGAKSEEFWSPVVLEAMNHGIELDERGDELIARAVLPGLRKSDFKVEVTDERLVIRGSKSRSSKNRVGDILGYQESSAAFAQAVALPCKIDRDHVKAKYKNGVLTVTLPKSDSAKSKRIKIQAA
jgi:HSP20 family molecular chaperone IbpA